MTASASIKVQPLGTIYPARIPPQPMQVLKAKRCLFGRSDPAETNRLYETEVQSNLQDFHGRYKVIGPLETFGLEKANADDSSSNSVDANIEISQTMSECSQPGGLAETCSDRPQLQPSEEVVICNRNSSGRTVSITLETKQKQSKKSAMKKNLIRCNPGPLGCFRVKKPRSQPYGRRNNQGSNPGSNGESS